MTYKEGVIHKAINKGPPTKMQENIDEKDINFHNSTSEYCIDLLGTFEAKDERRRVTLESKNPATKKNNEQPHGADSNSESIPRVTKKKLKTNPGKGKQQNNSIHCGTNHYCFLCYKSGHLECRYKSHSIWKCNALDSAKTNKYLYGRLDKLNASAKQFHKFKKNMRKIIKKLMKYDKVLFRLDKKNITHRDLNKIKKARKDRYESSISNNSSILSSDYMNSSISSLSERELKIPTKRKINNPDQILVTNINNNQVNDGIDDELKFDSSNNLVNNPV